MVQVPLNNSFKEILTSEVHKSTFKYLFNVTKTLPDCKATNVLNSHLLSRCQYLLTDVLNANKHPQFQSFVRCPKCCLPFNDGPAPVRVKPERKTKFLNKIHKKSAQNKPLTAYQTKIHKRFVEKDGRMLQTMCKMCKKVTYTPLVSPPKFSQTSSVPPSTVKLSTKPKRRKKKNKNKLCGLNESVVSAVQINSIKAGKKGKRDDFAPDPNVSALQTKPKKSAKAVEIIKQPERINYFAENNKMNKLRNKLMVRETRKAVTANKLQDFLTSVMNLK